MFQELFFVAKLAIACKVVHLAFLIYKFFLRPAKDLKKYGEWAVVTGCTSGIGRAYAFELAKQGFNIFLLSRSEDSLKSLEQEIRSKYSTLKVEHLAVDFAKFDESARAAVKSRLQ